MWTCWIWQTGQNFPLCWSHPRSQLSSCQAVRVCPHSQLRWLWKSPHPEAQAQGLKCSAKSPAVPLGLKFSQLKTKASEHLLPLSYLLVLSISQVLIHSTKPGNGLLLPLMSPSVAKLFSSCFGFQGNVNLQTESCPKFLKSEIWSANWIKEHIFLKKLQMTVAF